MCVAAGDDHSPGTERWAPAPLAHFGPPDDFFERNDAERTAIDAGAPRNRGTCIRASNRRRHEMRRDKPLLIGWNRSAYTRRVAISMHV